MKISNKIQSKNGLNIIIVGCGKSGNDPNRAIKQRRP